MIKFENLSKNFGEKQAVKSLDMKVAEGEIFAMLGPNGTGKTTTIKILAGLLHPTSGTAYIAGHNILTHGLEARSVLAYVPDEPHLYEKLTANEFLKLVGRLYGMPLAEIDEKISKLSEQFAFSEYMHELCAGYSHGMRQRVVIASALIHSPKVLIIDEPMVGLDPRSARIVKDTLKDLRKNGVSILMSTHTLPVAEELADRIGIIHNGEMVEIGTIEEIRRKIGREADLEEIFLTLTD